MALIPRSEMELILKENQVIEAKCEFCGTLYRSTPDEVRERLAAE
jgi:molecular chaperone Hsp33